MRLEKAGAELKGFCLRGFLIRLKAKHSLGMSRKGTCHKHHASSDLQKRQHKWSATAGSRKELTFRARSSVAEIVKCDTWLDGVSTDVERIICTLK